MTDQTFRPADEKTAPAPVSPLKSGGAMGAAMRAHDWAASGLGPIADWPHNLLAIVQVALDSPVPTLIAWGPQLLCLYNDAYRPLLGAKPDALGRPMLEVWSEAADGIAPLLQRALGGEATSHRDQRFELLRNHRREDAWFDFSFSPLRDDHGHVAGILNQCVETTARILADRARADGERRLRAALDAARLSSDFQALFETAPVPLLAIAPPDWTIVAANEARLTVTGATRDATIGRRLFDLFPDDPADPTADGVRNLTASLDRVVATRAPDMMAVQRYAIRNDQGRFEERWWSPINTPVLGADGRVALVVHRVEDVTDIVRLRGEAEARDQLARDQQDVIGRLRATEAAQRASEARYRQIVEGAEDFAIVSLDRAGLITGWNSGAERIVGFSRMEAVGAPASLFFTPEDRAAGAPAREREEAAAAGRAINERWHIRKDGGRFWASGLTMRLDQPDGGFLRIFRDRTSEHEAEAAQRASDARYKALFDSIETGFCIIEVRFGSHDGRNDLCIVEANPAFRRHSGLVGAEGKWLRDFRPDIEDHWYEIYGRVVGTGVSERFEQGSAALDRWFDVYAFPLGDPADRRVGVLFSDVSDRRAAEERLRRLNLALEGEVSEAVAERRLLSDVFDATGAFIQILDPAFNFLAINKANVDEYDRIYGLRPAAGDNMLDLLAGFPDQRDAARAYFDRALAGEAFVVTGEFGDPDRGTRWYEIKFSPLHNDAGELIGAYHFSLDITERRREQDRLADAEEQLRQSQKMEAMGALTGGVAHDFNNLLSPIVGGLDMLQRRGLGGEREQRLIEGALQSAERARILVQRLLAFARRQPLQARPVDVGALVTGMADLVASTSGPQIKVTVTVADDLPAAVADPNQVEMAILNLAVNARDAMSRGGDLRIAAFTRTIQPANAIHAATPAAHSIHAPHAAHPAQPTHARPGRYVCISIADTGVGMDEATARRAVEPFFSTKGIGRGTGLGLSMVHGLASQLGGALTIDSTLDLGTNVTIWLPASADAASDADATDVAAPPTGAAGTALLVDDEEFVRASTADMLTDLGYQVVEAGSAEEALGLVDGGLYFDLLVTDHLMPGMTGNELARILRGRRPDLRMLLVSGYAAAEGVAFDLPRLVKPFRQADLAAKLVELAG